MAQQFQTGVIIVGDDSGAVRAFKNVGEAAQLANAKLEQSAAEAKLAFGSLLDQIDPLRAKLRDVMDQQKLLQQGYASGAVSQADFSRYSAELSRRQAELSKSLGSSGAALNGYGVSARQTAQAMRMLPAQLTDIVVGLTSGQPAFMVAIQQGGQLKDSFGGIIPAARAMLGLLTPLSVGLGALAAGAGILGAAYIQGERDSIAFSNAIKLTGGYAGITEGQFREMAQTIARESNATIGSAKDVLQALVASGKFSGDALQNVGIAVERVAKLSDQSTDKVLQDFMGMSAGVTKWAQEHNAQYHFMSAAQLQYVAQLEEQGKTQEAMSAVSHALMQMQTADVNAFERQWLRTSATVSALWDALKTKIGGSSLTEDLVAEAAVKIKEMEAQRYNLLNGFDGNRAAYESALNKLKADYQALLDRQAKERADAAKPPVDADRTARLGDAQKVFEGLNKSLERQRELYGKGAADAALYELKQRKLAATTDEERAAMDKLAAPALKAARAVDALTASQNANRVSLVSQIKAQADSAIALARQEQGFSLADARAQFSGGLQAYSEYYASLQDIENTAYAKMAAARAIEQAKLADEIQRLRAMGLKAPEGAIQSAKQELESAQAESLRSAREHEQAMQDLARQRVDAMQAIRAEFDPATKAVDDYEKQLIRLESVEKTLSPEAYAKARERITLALQGNLKAIQDQQDPAAAMIRDLTAENAALAQGITLEQYRTRERLQAQGVLSEQIAQIETLTNQQRLLNSLFGDHTDEIRRSLSDALLRGFEDGKGFAKNFRDTLKNEFATLVLRVPVELIMQPVAQILNGLMGQITNGLIGNALGGGGAAGGGVAPGGMAGLLGGSGSMAGLQSYASVYMSALMPYAAAAAVAYAGYEFGRTLKPEGSNLSKDQYGLLTVASPMTAAIDHFTGGGLFGTKWVTKAQTLALAFTDSFADATITTVQKKKGALFSGTSKRVLTDDAASIDEALSLAFGQITESARKSADAMGLSLASDFSFAISESIKGLSTDEINAKVTELLGKASDALVSATLPGLDAFQQEGESLLDTLKRTSAGFVSVRGAIDYTGHSLDALAAQARVLSGDASAAAVVLGKLDITQGIIDASGGLDQFNSNFSSYLQGFYSDTERAAIQTQQLNQYLAQYGLTLPATSEGFRALVDTLLDVTSGLNVTSEAGQEAYAALLSISGAASQVYQTAQQASSTKLQDAQAAVQSAYENVLGAYNAAISAASAQVQQWRQLARNLSDFADGLIDKLLPATSQATATLQAQYDAAVAKARGGSAAAMNQLPSLGGALVDQFAKTARNAVEYNIAVAKVRADAMLAADAADAKGDVAMRQLASLQNAAKILAEQYTVQLQQVQATLTIGQAMDALAQAQSAYAAAQLQVAQGLVVRTDDLQTQVGGLYTQLDSLASLVNGLSGGSANETAAAAPVIAASVPARLVIAAAAGPAGGTSLNTAALERKLDTLNTSVQAVAVYTAKTAKKANDTADLLDSVIRGGNTLRTEAA